MIKAYGFAIANLPDPLRHPFQAKKAAEALRGLKGMLGIHPMPPQGTLLFFGTLNEAKVARNQWEATGNAVGNHIMNVEISDDMQNATILGPVDG